MTWPSVHRATMSPNCWRSVSESCTCRPAMVTGGTQSGTRPLAMVRESGSVTMIAIAGDERGRVGVERAVHRNLGLSAELAVMDGADFHPVQLPGREVVGASRGEP